MSECSFAILSSLRCWFPLSKRTLVARLWACSTGLTDEEIRAYGIEALQRCRNKKRPPPNPELIGIRWQDTVRRRTTR